MTNQPWQVDCAIPPNCNTQDCTGSSVGPFALRAVNTHGTVKDLTSGGFYSREFYISPKPVLSSNLDLPTTSSSATSSSSSSSSIGASTETSSSSVESTSSATSTPSAVQSTAELPASVEPTGSATSAPAAPATSNPSIIIGVGVGVGTGVVLVLGVAGFFLWRHHSRKTNQRDAQPPPSYPESSVNWQQKSSYNHTSTSPVEAPDREPQELPGRDVY